MRAHMRFQLVRGRLGTVAQDDEGVRGLAPALGRKLIN